MIPELQPYQDIIEKNAETFLLDPKLVCAFIMQESRGRAWAYRCEPDVTYIYHPKSYADKLHISMVTEITMQKTSWGLLQVMGFKARELGFDNHIPQLLLPSLGIEWGCRALNSFAKKHSGSDLIAAYNAGTPKKINGIYANQIYVDGVLSWLKVM